MLDKEIREKMEQIQRIVNEFDQLVSNKNNLNQELSKVNLMYSESKKSLEKLQQMGLTETDERVKNEIAKQASYLETINEIAAKFNSTNSEIEKYDKEKITKLNEYIILCGNFDRLCEEIRTAEKICLKSKEKKIQTVNAEGRKKFIDEDLIDYYNDLVKNKKIISKQVIQAKRIIADEDIDSLLFDKVSEDNISYTTMVPRKEYDPEQKLYKMSIDERLREAESKIERIKNAKGKKVYVSFENEHFTIPKVYLGRFNQLKGEIRKLKELKQKEVVEQPQNNEEVIIPEQPVIEEQPNHLNDNPDISGIRTEKDLQNFYNEQLNPRIQEVSRLMLRIIEETKKIQDQNKEYVEKIEKDLNSQKKEEISNNNSKKMAIKKITKGRKMVNKIKKVALTVATLATIATTAISGLGMFKNKNSDSKTNRNEVIQDINENNKKFNIEDEINNEPIFEGNDIKVSVDYSNQLDEEVVTIPDTISVNDNANIYTNSIDAVNQNNGLHPYYGYDNERNVLGVVIEMPGGKIITTYDEQIAVTLLQQGGNIKSYLTGTQNINGNYDYEGYYNANDIETGGKHR